MVRKVKAQDSKHLVSHDNVDSTNEVGRIETSNILPLHEYQFRESKLQEEQQDEDNEKEQQEKQCKHEEKANYEELKNSNVNRSKNAKINSNDNKSNNCDSQRDDNISSEESMTEYSPPDDYAVIKDEHHAENTQSTIDLLDYTSDRSRQNINNARKYNDNSVDAKDESEQEQEEEEYEELSEDEQEEEEELTEYEFSSDYKESTTVDDDGDDDDNITQRYRYNDDEDDNGVVELDNNAKVISNKNSKSESSKLEKDNYNNYTTRELQQANKNNFVSNKVSIADVEVYTKKSDLINKEHTKYFAVLWSRQCNDFQPQPLSHAPNGNITLSDMFLRSFAIHRSIITHRHYNALVECYLSAPHLRHALSIFQATLPRDEQHLRTSDAEYAYLTATSTNFGDYCVNDVDHYHDDVDNFYSNMQTNAGESKTNHQGYMFNNNDQLFCEEDRIAEIQRQCELQHNKRFHYLHESTLPQEYNLLENKQSTHAVNTYNDNDNNNDHVLETQTNRLQSTLTNFSNSKIVASTPASLASTPPEAKKYYWSQHNDNVDDCDKLEELKHDIESGAYEWCKSDVELLIKDAARLRMCNDDTVLWREMDFSETEVSFDVIDTCTLEHSRPHGFTNNGDNNNYNVNDNETYSNNNKNVSVQNSRNYNFTANKNLTSAYEHETRHSLLTHSVLGGSVDRLIEILILSECDEPYVNGIAESNYTNTFLTLSSLFITADVLITKFIRFFRTVWGWVIDVPHQNTYTISKKLELYDASSSTITSERVEHTSLANKDNKHADSKVWQEEEEEQTNKQKVNVARTALLERGHYLMCRALKCLMAFCRSHETDLTLRMFQQLSYFLMTCGVRSPMCVLNESPWSVLDWPCTHGIHSLRRYLPEFYTNNFNVVAHSKKALSSTNTISTTEKKKNYANRQRTGLIRDNSSQGTPESPLSPFTPYHAALKSNNIMLHKNNNNNNNDGSSSSSSGRASQIAPHSSFHLERQQSNTFSAYATASASASASHSPSRHGSRRHFATSAEDYCSKQSYEPHSTETLECSFYDDVYDDNDNYNYSANMDLHRHYSTRRRRPQCVPKLIACMHHLFQEQWNLEKEHFANKNKGKTQMNALPLTTTTTMTIRNESTFSQEVTESLIEFARYLEEIIHKHYERISVRLPWTTADRLESVMREKCLLYGSALDMDTVNDKNAPQNNFSKRMSNVSSSSTINNNNNFTNKNSTMNAHIVDVVSGKGSFNNNNNNNNSSNDKSNSSKCNTNIMNKMEQEQRSQLRSRMREVYTIVDTGAKRDRQSNVDIAKLLMERTNAMMSVMATRADPHEPAVYMMGNHTGHAANHIISGNSYMLVSGLRSRRTVHNTQISVMPSSYWVCCDNTNMEWSPTLTSTLAQSSVRGQRVSTPGEMLNNNTIKNKSRNELHNRSAMSNNSFSLFVSNTYNNACSHTLRPFDMDAQQFVHQLCLLSFYLFAEIPVRELFNNTWNNNEMQRCVPFHLTEFMSFNIRFQLWIVAVIVAQPQWRDCRRALHHFLDVCRVLYDVQNYEMASVLLNGLCHPTVQYLERLYMEIHHQEMLTPSAQRQRETLQGLMDPFASYSPSSLHSVTARTAGDMETPLIPIITPILTTLEKFEVTKGPTVLRRSCDGETLVNWTKISAIGAFVNLWLRCQLIPYTYPIDPILQEYLWSIRENTWNDEMLKEMAQRPKK